MSTSDDKSDSNTTPEGQGNQQFTGSLPVLTDSDKKRGWRISWILWIIGFLILLGGFYMLLVGFQRYLVPLHLPLILPVDNYVKAFSLQLAGILVEFIGSIFFIAGWVFKPKSAKKN